MLVLMLATALTMAQEAPRTQPPSLTSPVKLAALYGGCAALDLASTEVFLRRGVNEASPIMQTRGRRLAVKSLQTVGLVLIDRQIQKRSPKAAKWWRVGVVAAHVLVVAHNLRAR